MATFATALGDAIRAKPSLTLTDKAILKIVDGPQSFMRTRFLKRLEAHARIHLGMSSAEAIDWSSIDWNKVLDFLTKLAAIILAVLPLFAGRSPKRVAGNAHAKPASRSRNKHHR